MAEQNDGEIKMEFEEINEFKQDIYQLSDVHKDKDAFLDATI
jgi:hypothetical protein